MKPPAYRSTIVALALGQLLTWAALFYGFSSFVLPMQREFGWSKPGMMGAFTLGMTVWGVSSYAAGAAIDRGQGRWVMALGAALAGVGFLLWSQVHALAWLYVAWALMGAAMAMCLYEPAFSVLTKRFPDHYREGITSLTLVGGFASTLSFPAVAWLIATWGWRDALVVIGVVLLCGVAPLHAWALRGPDTPARPAAHDAADDATLHEALRHRAFWLLTITFTLYAFVSAALWAHIMPAFAAKGTSEAQALAAVMWVGPAQVAGRIVYLWLGRYVTPRRLGLVVLAGTPASLAVFALADHFGALLVFAACFGIANGLSTIVRGNIVPDYFGREHVGRISGAMTTIALVSRAAAPVAAAWLLLVVPGYREVMLVLALLGVGSWLAFALARPPLR
ncbi:MAG TPA: MFS transporter [Rhizobacter sp.]|nr:MFS transporter [Rhizobacter sp.]